jgi:hypothetical protein
MQGMHQQALVIERPIPDELYGSDPIVTDDLDADISVIHHPLYRQQLSTREEKEHKGAYPKPRTKCAASHSASNTPS